MEQHIMQKRVWFTPEEKNLLISIIRKYSDAITNKKTDAFSNHHKNKAWDAVSREFNALWLSSSRKRTLKQLKKCWAAIKFKEKQEHSNNHIGNIVTEGNAIIVDPALPFATLPITVVKEEYESSYDEAPSILSGKTAGNTYSHSGVTLNFDVVKSEAGDLSDTSQPTVVETSSSAIEIPRVPEETPYAAMEAPSATLSVLGNSAYSIPTDLRSESSIVDPLCQSDVQLTSDECSNVADEPELPRMDSGLPRVVKSGLPGVRATRRNGASREHFLRLAAKELYGQQKEERLLMRQLYRAKLLAVRRETRARISLLKAQRHHCCFRRQRQCDP